MPRNTKQHGKQFKLDAITYRKEHPDLTQAQCAKNLGIGVSTLARWEQQFHNSNGDIPVRGSDNYESIEVKEIVRLKRELRDAQDTLVKAAKTCKHRVSISGMLMFLNVSRSGYRTFLNRKLSPTRQRKDSVKKILQRIYVDSKQNYSAPKIAPKPRDSLFTVKIIWLLLNISLISSSL